MEGSQIMDEVSRRITEWRETRVKRTGSPNRNLRFAWAFFVYRRLLSYKLNYWVKEIINLKFMNDSIESCL